ncbi:MAG: PAS domain S-box protein [Myxococcales bacterium]|nr:PAS domain S-box protein [Myxococcales bacterium]
MDPATFECLPVAALLTRAGRVVAANPAYEAMMGLAAAAVVGRAVQELVVERIDPPDADLVARAATSRGEGRGLDGDLWCRVIDARGRRRAVHALWRPLPSDPATNLVFLLDDGGATEAKDAAETFARASGALYRACHEREVLEHAADALAAQGFVVTFLLIEPGDEYLRYGPTRSPPEVARRSRFEEAKVPRTVLAQINPRFHEGRAVFLQNLQDTVNQTYEADVARQIEEAKPGRFAMQAPLFVAGEAYGAIVLTSDFLSPALAGAAEMFAALVARAIENTRTQASLLQSERLAAIGEAAAMMAHEVRNPVATLLNAATLLRKREGDTEELLSMIEHEAQTLERIVSDLLALGRPLVASVVAEDLGAAVEGALAVARMRRPHVQVVLHAAAPVVASIDPPLLQIALLNLLRNAEEAAPVGAPIDVFVERIGEEPAVRIEDGGPGIPPSLSRRVLEPFFTTRPAGTGIGLAAVRRIVEACGGRVEVGSSETGGGRVTLFFR